MTKQAESIIQLIKTQRDENISLAITLIPSLDESSKEGVRSYVVSRYGAYIITQMVAPDCTDHYRPYYLKVLMENLVNSKVIQASLEVIYSGDPSFAMSILRADKKLAKEVYETLKGFDFLEGGITAKEVYDNHQKDLVQRYIPLRVLIVSSMSDSQVKKTIDTFVQKMEGRIKDVQAIIQGV